jgi:uncharacterized RDD family membrane protein YckC
MLHSMTMAMHYSNRHWHRGGARKGYQMTGCHTVLERINVSNENWNDPAKTPSQPQPPYGQPAAPDPQAPPAPPAPETPGAGSYSSPTYTTPSYTPPVYGTPDAGPAASPASGTPSYGAPAGGGYTAPDSTPAYGAAPSTPAYGTPATGGYTAPDPTPAYGAAPSYGTDPNAPAYGSTPPAYGSAPSAGSYGSAPEPAAGSGYPDPNQAYGAAGGYGQSQPGQYGAAGYGQPVEGYQDPNAAYGAAPAAVPGAGYPNTGVSAYGYDAGYASPTPELASFGTRALGWLIDYLAPGIVYAILISIINNLGSSVIVGLLTFVVWVAEIAFILWNSGYQAGITGYSLGRKIAKTKLVSEATGQPLGAGAGIGRVFAHLIDSVICYVGWLFPLWDSKRQTIADKIVKSVVVSDPNAGQAPQQ